MLLLDPVVCIELRALANADFALMIGKASQARFTKYLTTVSGLSYDNAEVTVDI